MNTPNRTQSGLCLLMLALPLGGCPVDPTPTPDPTDTPTNIDTSPTPTSNPDTPTATVTPDTPTATATPDTPTATPDTPTATATPDTPTPTATPDTPPPTPTPVSGECVVPQDGLAVCMMVNDQEILVDGVVISPDAPEDILSGVWPVERMRLVFNGVDLVSMEAAAGTDPEGGDPQPIPDLTVLNPIGFNGAGIESVPEVINVAGDVGTDFGVDIDVSAYSAFGSGWSMGEPNDGAEFIKEVIQHGGDCTGESCNVLVGQTDVIYSEESSSITLSFDSSPVDECQVRFFHQFVLVAETLVPCTGATFNFDANAAPLEGGRIDPLPGADPIPAGAQDWDVGESLAKIRYTFTGYQGYEFDLP